MEVIVVNLVAVPTNAKEDSNHNQTKK